MITEAKGFEMPFVKWPFWCVSEEWFMKEMSFGLKKACALREIKGKAVYNTLNNFKVIRKITYKGFSESFYHYTGKTQRNLAGFLF